MSTNELASFGEMIQVIDDLAVIVRNARRAERLSTRELGAKLGMSPSTVWRIEEGRESRVMALGQSASHIAAPGLCWRCNLPYPCADLKSLASRLGMNIDG